ncbi:ABC transporter substrate-binding protein [Sodalis sp. RH24]|uniref:ABC transporter substrate-binding protein n=1 Tax=unclassified Sodalis (in: enterobacteria) TaxID=2636512 RepID=UPI0039B622A3
MTQRGYLFSTFFCLALSAAAKAEEQIIVGLNIPQTVVDGSIYSAADKLGYFRAENLAVKTIVFQGAGALLPQVNSKKIDIGFPMPEPVLASYAPGKQPLPVQFFYNARPSGGMELAVLDSSPIKTLADLKGKKIGVGALTWASIPQTRAVLANQGLNPDKDVQIVATGALGAGFLALKEGRVDALNFNQSWHDMLEQSGTKIRRLSYPAEFSAMVGNGFIAHNDTLRDRRAMLVGFGRAITKATLACEANPGFCVQTFWQAQPELKPGAEVYQARLKDAVFLLERRLKRTLYTPEGQPVVPGRYDIDAIARYVALMHDAGELDVASVPLDKIFTNALVGDINHFDKQAVQQQARVAKMEEN